MEFENLEDMSGIVSVNSFAFPLSIISDKGRLNLSIEYIDFLYCRCGELSFLK